MGDVLFLPDSTQAPSSRAAYDESCSLPCEDMDQRSSILEEFATHLRRLRRAPETIRIRLLYARKLFELLDPLTAGDEELQGFLDRHHWSPGTINVVTATIHDFYRFLQLRGYRLERPDGYLRYVDVPPPRSRIAAEAVLAQAVEISNDQDEILIRLGAECGLRVEEIRLAHSDNRDGEFQIVLGKGSKWREVWLSPELRELLDRQPSGYYIHRDGVPVSKTTIYNRVWRLIGSNPHSLRHRGGTVVYRRSDKDLRLTQQFLGHADPRTTVVYVHVTRDELREAGEHARIRRRDEDARAA